MSSYFLFVYGTCKRGQRNNHVLHEPGCESVFLGKACSTDPYPLVTASQYNLPFLLPLKGVGKNIEGEVYRIDEKMLHKMDKFECVPMLYERNLIEVQLADGQVLECVCYMLTNHHPSLLQKEFIECYDEQHSPILMAATETSLPAMPTGIQMHSVVEL